MEFKDYYAILGVEPDAEKADIKTAYRKLARKYHPDLNPEDDAEEKFKEVAEAWEVLGDDTRRAEFDELRRYGAAGSGQGFEPPPGWESRAGAGGHHFSGDFSDFFNNIFGAEFEPNGAGQGFQRGRRGQDVEIEMPVFLEETLADTKKPVEYEIPVIENGRRVNRRKSLKVTIPAGAGDGERIRLRGQGIPGQGGAPDGDLYLHIRLVPHPLFDVQGHDLLVTIPLAPWEAALGAKVTVPTLDGKVTVTVAPDSQAGRKLRLKGKGLVSKAGRGDLYAVLKVTMPTESSARARELWQSLADELDYDPRTEWRASA